MRCFFIILFMAISLQAHGHEPKQFEADLRDWLMANPEILLEMSAELERRQLEAQSAYDETIVAQNYEALFHDGRDGQLMSDTEEAGLILVEFLDYNCGYCRRQHRLFISATDALPNLQIIFKEYPILGQGSNDAARIALAVKAEYGTARYLELQDRFLTHQGQIDKASIAQILADMSLPVDVLFERARQEDIQVHLLDNQALAARLGIQGTPAFVTKNRILRGLLEKAQLLALYEAQE